ncbi:hypothetical protein QQP08_014277 [Theobroma cacao]|nr:hypothetical protein QQP08_014277 [Theobroma cacao]
MAANVDQSTRKNPSLSIRSSGLRCVDEGLGICALRIGQWRSFRSVLEFRSWPLHLSVLDTHKEKDKFEIPINAVAWVHYRHHVLTGGRGTVCSVVG